MSIAPLTATESPTLRSADMICRIAGALGISEAALLSRTITEVEIGNTSELLRIWASLEQAADRRKLLTFARALATGRPPA